MLSLKELPRLEVLEADARKYSSTDPAAVIAFLSMLISAAELERLIEPHFAAFGISQGRFVILMALRRRDGHRATPAELADHASVTRATITGLLDGLESDRLVERVARADDKRSVDVRLTKKGLAVVEKMLPSHYARIGAVMSKLSKQETRQLAVLVDKVRAGIAEAADAALDPTRTSVAPSAG